MPTSCDGNFVLQPVIRDPPGHLCQDLQQITLYEVCLGQTSSNVAAIQLTVGEFDPFSQVFQAEECIVSERISAIVANATQLTETSALMNTKRGR